MSNDVVISKELRDEIMIHVTNEWPIPSRITDQLRAAPETVSLEWMELADYLLPDIQNAMAPQDNLEEEECQVLALVLAGKVIRLVAPVQPSAVVSRNRWSYFFEDDEWTVTEIGSDGMDLRAVASFNRKEDVELACSWMRSTPQPVAAGQGGGVELVERWRLFLLSDPVGTEWWQMHRDLLERLAHLQSPAESEVKPVGPIDGMIITEEFYEQLCNWFESNPDKSSESLLAGLAIAQKHRRNV